MTSLMPATHTAFVDHALLAAGSLAEVALAARRAADGDPGAAVFIYEDATGRAIDVDTRGTDAEIVARLPAPVEPEAEGSPALPRGRGRPRLGVVAREVTLLPRHWEWLAGQPGGASVALRKLVEQARREHAGADALRRGRDAAYAFMSAAAGNLPGFEEAARALYAGDMARLAAHMAGWPADVRAYALRLAGAADAPA
ncbi:MULTISPECIES: DUF2239 family protein [Bordetella]|uniref:DUF2239 domain-containing protein n=1 Tax=Bordetella genomosp. 6 TaxID=463024 RepID=A0ABX4FD89_9BORD|nr:MULTISPECIES: DUF2239 family protein [Bordetella]AOB27276.1 hypothetical protein BBB44_14000 [Bordetella bronchiseptica]AZW44585.1 DUF2239 domain-containing protein [Bordetella bronchiseptica]KCV66690.1 PF09998 family protein [Bordetella bronchiseptica 99-R-0433]OZI78662.1 hypothetical protein CAL23_12625 [Bordetella genomosp. 6]